MQLQAPVPPEMLGQAPEALDWHAASSANAARRGRGTRRECHDLCQRHAASGFNLGQCLPGQILGCPRTGCLG